MITQEERNKEIISQILSEIEEGFEISYKNGSTYWIKKYFDEYLVEGAGQECRLYDVDDFKEFMKRIVK